MKGQQPLYFVILVRNTHGTYFSCPSLEISSTSFSKRLSIAISTAKRDAILKDFQVRLGRMGRMGSIMDLKSRARIRRCVQTLQTWRARKTGGRQQFLYWR